MLRHVVGVIFLVFLAGVLFSVWLLLPGNMAQVSKLPVVSTFFASAPCSKPLHYAVGNFDPRFGITEDDFRMAIKEAGSVWESASGRTLFVYDEAADFKINLIYDERQQETDHLKELSQSLSEVRETQAVLNQKQRSLSSRYETEKSEYEQLIQTYEQELRAYNSVVEYWNDQGGAPENEYRKLRKEKTTLKKDYQNLEAKRAELNALVRSLNATSQVETKAIEQYNSQVEEYTQTYGEPEEFQEGLYIGTAIDIYQFEDRAQLILVLTHELGHTLGIDHVENSTSLMYHFMADQGEHPILSNQDIAALKTACALE